MKMALTLPKPLHYLPFSPLHSSSPNKLSTNLHPHSQSLPFKPLTLSIKHRHHFLTRATENGAQTDNDADTPTEVPKSEVSEVDRLSEVGEEIKKAMKERAESGSGGGIGEFWNGVVEEIGQIEWPQFGKVLGTTGVVLAVIAGSSVVLLTLNAVLAELSDQVFVGKGVQDFFAG